MNKIEVAKLYYQDWATEFTIFNINQSIAIKKHEPFMVLGYEDVELVSMMKVYQKIHILTSQGLKCWFFIDLEKHGHLMHKLNTEAPDTIHSPCK